MQHSANSFGQPIGFSLPSWQPPAVPDRQILQGQYCRLEPLDSDRHAARLYAAHQVDDASHWTYLAYGPFENEHDYTTWMRGICAANDPLFFAVLDLPEQRPLGIASYLRITPSSGSIEVGHIHYSRELRLSRAGTEAMYLLMREAFRLGYRRYEWKCDALNEPSRRAAERLGFRYEGTFRQATVYKGRNRDTAWYAIIDKDWPRIETAFQTWLAPGNFDRQQCQRIRLSELTRGV